MARHYNWDRHALIGRLGNRRSVKLEGKGAVAWALDGTVSIQHYGTTIVSFLPDGLAEIDLSYSSLTTLRFINNAVNSYGVHVYRRNFRTIVRIGEEEIRAEGNRVVFQWDSTEEEIT